MSRKERVLQALRQGPKTNWEIQSVEIGGVAGLRRLRELRTEGYMIEMKRLERNGKPSGTFEYRLVSEPVPRCPSGTLMSSDGLNVGNYLQPRHCFLKESNGQLMMNL